MLNQFIRPKGMMYCLENPKQSLESVLSQIIKHSLKRINKPPDVIEVHPSMIPGETDRIIAGIRLVATPGIAPGHFFQGY